MNFYCLFTILLLLNLSVVLASEISHDQRVHAQKLLDPSQNNTSKANSIEENANKIFLLDYMAYMNKLDEIKQSKEQILRAMNNFGKLSHQKEALVNNLNQSWAAIVTLKNQKPRIAYGIYHKLRF